MAIKKAPLMQLPAEQQALLTGMLPELRRMANSVHWRFFNGYSDVCTREDLLQDTLFNIYRSSVYPPADKEQLIKWANVAMRNRARDVTTKAAKDKAGAWDYMREMEYHAIVPYTGEEKVAYLMRMAQKHFRPVVQQVLIGYGLGHSGNQIAKDLGIPRNTVKTHFHTAKKRLLAMQLTGI